MYGRTIVLLLVLGCAMAQADTLRSSRAGSLEEVSHAVDVRLVDGVATMLVQRSFRNLGRTDDEALLSIELPKGAAATGLRVLHKGHWQPARLLDRTAAQELYRKSPRGRVPATLLQWTRTGAVHLHVYPVAPGEVATIEYKLTAPTQYWGGRYRFSYPRALPRTNLVNPTIAVTPGWASSEILIEGRVVPVRRAVQIATSTYLPPPGDQVATHATITVAPPDGISARYGRVVASAVRSFGRLEIDVGPLSKVPVAPNVVFVLDTSHSAGPNLIAAQLATMRAYLSHVPDAQVEIVVYNRRAARLFNAFVPIAELERRLAEPALRTRLAPANGSAVDEGAHLASAALLGRTGERRIVIFTDELVRSSLTAALAGGALAGLAKEVVVHVVVPDERGEVQLKRDDKRPLSLLATAHHGIFARLWGIPATTPDPKLTAAALELVRPTRFEQAGVTGGYSIYVPEAGESNVLREGDGLRVFDNNRTAVPPRVTLTGVLWSDKVTRELDGEAPGFAQAAAALVFGEDKFYGLRPAEQRALALKARAVTQHTSYVTLSKGTRPSNGVGSLGMRGRTATAPRVRFGTPSMTDSNPTVDLESFIDKKRCVALHNPAAGWRVTLLVETTRDEIVDVSHAGPASPFSACLVESAWAARLDHRFTAQRKSFVVDLGVEGTNATR